MRSKRLVSIVAVLAVLGVGTTGVAFAGESKPDFSKLKKIKEPNPCKNDPGITDDTIKVGVITIESGPQGVTFAPSTMQGIQARIDEANGSGELGDRQIELVVKDDQANQANNLTAAQQLVEEEEVFGIIEQSNVSDGSAKYLNEEKIPVAGWHIGQKEWGIYPNMFSWRNSQPPDPSKQFTSRNADVMKKLGAKKIAVVGTNVASGAIFLEQVATGRREDQGDGRRLQDDRRHRPSSRTSRGSQRRSRTTVPTASTRHSQACKRTGSARRSGRRASSSRPSSSRAATTTVCWVSPATTGRTSGPSSSRSRWAHPGLTKYEAAMEAAGFEPLRFFAIQGYFGADAFVEGIKAAGVGCPTRKAFINNLRLQKGYDAGGAFIPVDRAEIFGRIFYCVFYVQVQNQQFVPAFDGEPICAKQLFDNGKARKLSKAEQAKG